MLKTLFTPFVYSVTPSTQKQSVAMMVTSHDINFVMGFIKEEEMFSSPNASIQAPTTVSTTNVSYKSNNMKCFHYLNEDIFIKAKSMVEMEIFHRQESLFESDRINTQTKRSVDLSRSSSPFLE